jgi:hypothetical protein
LRHFIERPAYRVMLPKMPNSSKYRHLASLRIAIKNELRPALSAVKRMDIMGNGDEKQPGQVGLASGQIRFRNDGV